MTDRAHYSRGRAMFPIIRHRTLVGIRETPFDRVRCGEIIACRGKNLPFLLRVTAREGRAGQLTCLSEYRGNRFQVSEREYRGVAFWRSYRGSRQSLEVDEGAFLCRIYLAAARAELRARFVAPLRKKLSLRTFTSGESPASTGEASYLLDCLRSIIDESRAKTPLPPGGMDWGVYLDLSLGHAVNNMLRPLWESLPSQHALPRYAKQLLADEGERTERSWEEARQILGLLLPVLKEAGIPCLLLKGPSLAEAYGDRFKVRGFADLDLLVQPREIGRALDCLEKHGFVPKAGGKARSLILKGHFHLVMKPPDPWTLPVELHWELVDRGNLFRIDPASVFARARTLKISAGSVPALGVVDNLVYLCLHLGKHGAMNRFALYGEDGTGLLTSLDSGNRLVWFIDILFFIEKKGGDIASSLLWERASSWNAEEKVLECLQLVNRLFPSSAVEDYIKAFPYSGPRSRGAAEAIKPFWMGGKRRQKILNWAMSPHPLFSLRPVRLVELWGLFFPSRHKLRSYYGSGNHGNMIWRHFTHPFHMARRLFH